MNLNSAPHLGEAFFDFASNVLDKPVSAKLTTLKTLVNHFGGHNLKPIRMIKGNRNLKRLDPPF
jgi:hypothetical protein